MKRKSLLIRAVVLLLLGCVSFFGHSLIHSTGHTGSTLVTQNEISRLVGASSISCNEVTRFALNCVSWALLLLGGILVVYATLFFFKYLKTSKKFRDLLNKIFGGK